MQTPAPIVFDYQQLDHAHLVRVVSVGVTRRVDDAALTLMSVELYQAGFAIVLLIEQASAAPAGAACDLPLILNAMAAIDARDDTGRVYAGRNRAGAGGVGASGAQMRTVYTFTPALDPDTRALRLDVTWVRRLHWHADGSAAWGAADVVAGPVSAVFPLDGAGHA